MQYSQVTTRRLLWDRALRYGVLYADALQHGHRLKKHMHGGQEGPYGRERCVLLKETPGMKVAPTLDVD